jgi:hypothetical protein
MKALEEEKLISLYSPALAGPKLNLATFAKLQKARQTTPVDYRIHAMPLFLAVLFEKLNAKERAELIKAAALTKAEVNGAQKIDQAANKLERMLKSAKLQKTSQLYQILVKAPGELVLHLMVYSDQRLVQDRIKNYFAKYLPASLEITDEMVTATGVAAGTPKFQRAKEELILTRLDARPKKPPPEPEPPPPPPMSSFARGPGPRAPR